MRSLVLVSKTLAEDEILFSIFSLMIFLLKPGGPILPLSLILTAISFETGMGCIAIAIQRSGFYTNFSCFTNRMRLKNQEPQHIKYHIHPRPSTLQLQLGRE